MLKAKTSWLPPRDPRRDDCNPQCIIRILVLCALLWPAPTNAQNGIINGAHSAPTKHILTHPGTVGFAPVAELENRPRSDFENSLMSELACTCGTCKLEVINTCRCDFAAKMRGEVRTQLDDLDLSTAAARHVAKEAVRATFVERYGERVLDRANRVDPEGHLATFVVTAIVLSLFFVVVLRRRSARRHAG